jgi:hypothetical protein
MDRADNIFHFDERISDSPLVERVWRTTSGGPEEAFVSGAAINWEMVVTRPHGKRAYLTVRGPETRASTVPIPANAEFFGVTFKLGTFMPGLPFGHLVDDLVTLPEASETSFWLHGSAWDLPDFDAADVFVGRLVREGLLVRDPLVEAAVDGRDVDLSLRSVQRRIVRATGLTRDGIRQIERARTAAQVLDRGVPILDVVAQLGYADQAHLTRSVRRFIGLTPAQIIQLSRGTR